MRRQLLLAGKVVLFFFLPAGARGQEMGTEFLRGDLTGDGVVDEADVHTCVGLGRLLDSQLYGPAFDCWDAVDADDDGRATVADCIFLLSFLTMRFDRRPEMTEPFPFCGPDPTPDSLPECRYSVDACEAALPDSVEDPDLGLGPSLETGEHDPRALLIGVQLDLDLLGSGTPVRELHLQLCLDPGLAAAGAEGFPAYRTPPDLRARWIFFEDADDPVSGSIE